MTDPIYTAYPSQAAWLACRQSRITGTTAAGILGASPWSSPWSIWARATGAEMPGPSGQAIQRGHDLEPVALARYRRQHLPDGCTLDDRPWLVVEREDAPLWLGSPDAIVRAGQGYAIGGVEVKTVSRSDLAYLWSDDDPAPHWVRDLDGMDVEAGGDASHIPLSWQVQIHTYLMVSRLPWWDLVILGPHVDDTHVLRIHADPPIQEYVRRSCEAWWSRYVVGGEPPEPDDSPATYDAVRAIWPPRERAETITLDEDAASVAADYAEAAVAKRDAEKRRKRARSRLAAMMGSAQAATAGEYTITMDARGALRVSRHGGTDE